MTLNNNCTKQTNTWTRIGIGSFFSNYGLCWTQILNIYLGPPIPAEDTLNIQGDFIMGEPATLYIPFHAYPVPTK